MITDNSDLKITPRKTVKVSDLEIIHGAVTTKFWHTFLYKHWSEFVVLSLRQYFRFNRAMMASLHWCVFRFKPGSHTMGSMSIGAALSFCFSLNSTHVPILFKPFAAFVVPFLPFFKTQEELYRLVVVDVESQFVLIYTGVFLIASLVHVVIIWIGKSNPSLSKRGESWIALGLSKWMKVDEFVISGIFEPLISVCIGVALLKFSGDVYGCVFMVLIGVSEATQQILDKAHQSHIESIIKA
ncbi:MAG: hypothetical protein RIF46_07700 [Cyclobacteriaceae bacterium]